MEKGSRYSPLMHYCSTWWRRQAWVSVDGWQPGNTDKPRTWRIFFFIIFWVGWEKLDTLFRFRLDQRQVIGLRVGFLLARGAFRSFSMHHVTSTLRVQRVLSLANRKRSRAPIRLVKRVQVGRRGMPVIASMLEGLVRFPSILINHSKEVAFPFLRLESVALLSRGRRGEE